MAAKSITQRWIKNTLSIIFAVLVFIAIAFSYSMKNFYYNSVRQTMTSRANVVYSLLARIVEDNTVNFNAELRKLVENSEDKEQFEITAIDHNGRVALSSSGFSYQRQDAMPDYREALKSSDGMGYYVGKTSSGEKIMAVTLMLPSITAEYSAVRYVVSLENVDRLLFTYMGMFLLATVAVLAFVMISGFYFIKSIVIPVREVSAVARKFATGDMSARIVKKNEDELGELCDLINYMADEITASEELKNEFISSVSHELRTPLTAIKGWSETLLTLKDSAQDSATMEKGLRVIDSETERLSGMVEELLDFSRIQNGKLTLVKTKMDILAELGEAVLMYAERARRDNIELVYHEPEYLSPIFGDKNRLRQVFINVIDNALKYSDAGDRATVSASEQDGNIRITVADTGCGIRPEDLPKIKTKFFKANTTRRGSGIGLAVANEIVLMHGGEIDIESEWTKGTAVTIRLPVNLKKGDKPKTEISTTMEFTIPEERKSNDSELQ